MEVHKDVIHSIETDITQKKIVTACADGIVRIFNKSQTEDGEFKLSMEYEVVADSGPITKAVFVNLGEFVAVAHFSGKITLWKQEGQTYSKKYESTLLKGSVNDISATWENSSFVLYCACSDGKARIINVSSAFTTTETEVFCHRFGVSSISSQGKYFVTGGMDYSVALWEGEKEVTRFRDHKSFVRAVKICPTNCFDIFCFASCSEDGSIVIYSKKGDAFEKQHILLEEPCYSVSWSSSGFTLSVGYGDSKFKCYVPDCEGQFKEVELSKINS